ncbi:unnamed protein product, partial [Laminaria digitata]
RRPSVCACACATRQDLEGEMSGIDVGGDESLGASLEVPEYPMMGRTYSEGHEGGTDYDNDDDDDDEDDLDVGDASLRDDNESVAWGQSLPGDHQGPLQ